jgi:hypothetical protein
MTLMSTALKKLIDCHAPLRALHTGAVSPFEKIKQLKGFYFTRRLVAAPGRHGKN